MADEPSEGRGGWSNNKSKSPKEMVEKWSGPKDRLYEREIRWILSQKYVLQPRCYEMEAVMPLPVPDVDQSEVEVDEEMEAQEDGIHLRKLRRWLREELASNKGYVEMYDYCTRRRAAHQEIIAEAWKEVEKTLAELPLDIASDDDDDSEDDEEYRFRRCCHLVEEDHLLSTKQKSSG